MSEEKEPVLGEPGEHPLSVFLFSWMRTPLFKTVVTWSLVVIGAALIGLEMLLAFRPIKDVTYAPGFQGVFGFVAFAFAVLSGWPLGKMLRRPEGYYDKRSGEAGRDD
jgi:sugar phosphate permease